jgi:hypothetical protein
MGASMDMIGQRIEHMYQFVKGVVERWCGQSAFAASASCHYSFSVRRGGPAAEKSAVLLILMSDKEFHPALIPLGDTTQYGRDLRYTCKRENPQSRRPRRKAMKKQMKVLRSGMLMVLGALLLAHHKPG